MDPLAAIGAREDAEIRIDEAALHLAAADRGRVDLAPSVAYLESLGARLTRGLESAEGRADALVALMAGAEDFRGDSEDYVAPRNADMLAVLARRRGLPIALAILYVATARRAGWNARVLALPGHVLVGVEGAGELVVLDAFAGGKPVEAPRGAGRSGSGRTPEAAWLGNREALVRLVMNQASRARQGGDSARALTLYRRLTLIAPAMPALWWERARLERLAGDTGAARRSLAAMRETTRDPALSDRIRQAYDSLAR